MFNIGGSELALVLLAALLLLGPARIPQFVRGAARWYREFLKMKEQVDASLSEIREEIEKEGQPARQVLQELEGIRRHNLQAAIEERDTESPAGPDTEAAEPAAASTPDNSPAGAAALIRPPEGRRLASGSLADSAQSTAENAAKESTVAEERP